MVDKPIEEKSAKIWPFILAIVFVLATWLLNLKLLINISDRGVYGDMFGAANSVFSGLAFAGVVYAIFLQRHEVEIAKEEISRTKQILKEQQNIARQQSQAQKIQVFEGTFFNLLRIFADVRSAIDLRNNQGVVTASGSECLRIFLNRVEKKVQKSAGPKDSVQAFEELYLQLNSELGHYFRTLYNLVKFVDRSEIDDKRLYTNLVRAQLSDPEAEILFLNGLTARGAKFKPLIERYALLKNIRKDHPLFAEKMAEYDQASF
jgi:Putative phage abortive infection protein